jgi:hypothetical protein
MSRIVVVAPLRENARDRARRLVEQGPPFDLPASALDRHHVHLTDREVIFVFEGPDARAAVEQVVGEPGVWKAASEWRACLAGRPRIADETFEWARDG